jgi:hypothetical protein
MMSRGRRGRRMAGYYKATRLRDRLAFWRYGLTPRGKLDALGYALRRLFVAPVDEGRCFMGGPVDSMVHCPRAALPDSMWCKAHICG